MEKEVVYTDKREVCCDGGKGPLGHPAVYLKIATDEGEIICPYCSKRFVLKEQK